MQFPSGISWWAGKGSIKPTAAIISRRERKQLTLADKLAQFPEALAAWDALATAGAAASAAQAAKAAAVVQVGRGTHLMLVMKHTLISSAPTCQCHLPVFVRSMARYWTPYRSCHQARSIPLDH